VTKPQVTRFAFPWQGELHFSQSVRTDDLVFASGQAGFRAEGGLAGEDFETQCRQAFDNLDRVFRAQGASLDSMVRLNAFLSDASQYAAFKSIRAEYLAEPYPASTAVVVGFVFPGMLVELEGIAVRGGASREVDAESATYPGDAPG
jgi:enamine deaminase RidA (YjgF/YER057c/UK114 family)